MHCNKKNILTKYKVLCVFKLRLHNFFIQKDTVNGEVSVAQKTPFHSDVKSGNYILTASLKKLVISIIKLYMQADQSCNSTNVNKFQGTTSGYHIYLKKIIHVFFFPPKSIT